MMLETAGKSTSSKVIKGGWLRDALKVKRAVGKLSEELHQSMQVWDGENEMVKMILGK